MNVLTDIALPVVPPSTCTGTFALYSNGTIVQNPVYYKSNWITNFYVGQIDCDHSDLPTVPATLALFCITFFVTVYPLLLCFNRICASSFWHAAVPGDNQ